MTYNILVHINNVLNDAGINYAYKRWNKEVTYPYWVGDGEEVEVTDEDGFHEYNFRLTGTTRGTWEKLESDKEIIENILNTTTILGDSGVVFSYAGTLSVPTDDVELKRIQINIIIQEWRVN